MEGSGNTAYSVGPGFSPSPQAVNPVYADSKPSLSVAQTDACWFAEDVQPHEPALRAWLKARFPSLTDIDDLVQETYARLFRIRAVRKVAETRPYLFVIARNAAVDAMRRNRVISFENLGESERLSVVEEDKPTAAAAASYAEELVLLKDAIAVLPGRCREVLTLRKLHGLSYREIAQQLGIAEKTVEAHVHTGLFRCREYLQAKGVTRERLQHVKEPQRPNLIT